MVNNKDTGIFFYPENLKKSTLIRLVLEIDFNRPDPNQPSSKRTTWKENGTMCLLLGRGPFMKQRGGGVRQMSTILHKLAWQICQRGGRGGKNSKSCQLILFMNGPWCNANACRCYKNSNHSLNCYDKRLLSVIHLANDIRIFWIAKKFPTFHK